ncbi:MAG: hypothetical protein AB1758_18845 [Candidatus Eremiobacterota bacterium]
MNAVDPGGLQVRVVWREAGQQRERVYLTTEDFLLAARDFENGVIDLIQFEGHGNSEFQGDDPGNRSYLAGGLYREQDANGEWSVVARKRGNSKTGEKGQLLGNFAELITPKLNYNASIQLFGCFCASGAQDNLNSIAQTLSRELPKGTWVLAAQGGVDSPNPRILIGELPSLGLHSWNWGVMKDPVLFRNGAVFEVLPPGAYTLPVISTNGVR